MSLNAQALVDTLDEIKNDGLVDLVTKAYDRGRIDAMPIVRTLELRIAGLERLLKKAVKCMPVAADCPKPNSNVCDYTDAEWEEIVAFTRKAKDYLDNGGML